MLALPSLEKLHHAYILTGDQAGSQKELLAWLEKNNIKTQGNPDVLCQNFTSLTIDNVRDLKLQESQTHGAGKKFFIFTIETVNHEAQHALLKILEEPSKETFFFFCVQSEHIFFPTVLSRAHVISRKGSAATAKISASDFLKMKKSGRIEMIKKIMDKKAPEEIKPSRYEVSLFLNELEELLSQESRENASTLHQIFTLREYLKNSGSSPKMILEQVALLSPVYNKNS